jgi:hypothetical protein
MTEAKIEIPVYTDMVNRRWAAPHRVTSSGEVVRLDSLKQFIGQMQQLIILAIDVGKLFGKL